MDHETARELLHDLSARTLIAAYVEECDGRSLTKIDPVTGGPIAEAEPGDIVRAVLQWHGAGWAEEVPPGWHCFVDDRYLFAPGERSELRQAVDQALAMLDDADGEPPEEEDAASADAPTDAGATAQQTATAGAAPAATPPTRAGRVGDLRVGTVVIDVQDMRRAVAFWCEALGYRPREEQVDPAFTMLVDKAGRGLPISLQAADTPPEEPVRLHLDLYTSNQSGHVSRLLELGASEVKDWPYPPDADFVVLRDPDGNEFCVIDHPGR